MIRDGDTYQMGYWGRGLFSPDLSKAHYYALLEAAEKALESAKTDPAFGIHPNAVIEIVPSPPHRGPFAG